VKPKENTVRLIRTPTAVRAAILALLLVPVIGVQLMLAGGPRGPVVRARPVSGLDFDASKIQLGFTRIVADGLLKPVFVTHANDGSGRLFVVEQDGKIKVVVNGVVTATFLDITNIVSKGSERGLLGLAFHPGYATNGRFFVYYTNASGDPVVAGFRNANPADNSGEENMYTLLGPISHPFSNHNGGMLAFGPGGYLFIGSGDGGSGGDPGNRAQNKDSLLGKILRIGVGPDQGSYTTTGNPYDGGIAGANEVWAIGARNPWRFSLDSKTGDLWIGDVGQDRYEEINRSIFPLAGGLNYGWRQVEGNTCFNPSSGCNKSGKTAPMAVYSHSLGCSVTGGYVYRGLDYRGLVGGYLFGDYCSGRIWTLKASGPNTQTPVLMADTNFAISSFGEGPDGKIYVTDLGRGDIWLVTATNR
jgi:glucose/arabinose dehydrogenase